MSLINALVRLTSMPVGTARQGALDGLRGYAVVLVFFVHFAGGYLVRRGGNPDVVPFTGWTGAFDKVLYWLYSSHHGVLLFFVLSGFLITRMVVDNPRFEYRHFLQRRIVRIYPAFLLAMALTVVVGVAWGLPAPGTKLVLLNLVFINGVPGSGVPGILGNNVSWSLFYEMVFYLVFPVWIIAARALGLSRVFSLLCGGIALAYLPGVFGVRLDRFEFFFAGAAVGVLRADSIRAVARHVSDLGLVLCYLFITTAHMARYLDDGRFSLLFALAGSLLLLKAASGEGLLARMLSWPPIVWLGGVSYSFYLLHSLALGFAFKWTSHWVGGTPVQAVAVAMLGFALATVLAALSFAGSERLYFRGTAIGAALQRRVAACRQD